MKKIVIIAAVIVVIVGGVLVGINYYEGRVTRSIKEMTTQLPPNWKAEIDYVNYSLFGNNLVLGGFSLSIDGSEGRYDITAAEVLIDSLDASVFRTNMPGRLAGAITVKDFNMSMPGGTVHQVEYFEVTDVLGNFTHLGELIQNKAPAEIILPVLYQIRATQYNFRNMTIKDESMDFDTCVAASGRGKSVTALSAKQLTINDMKMYNDEKLAASIESMDGAMDFSALANVYVPGKEMELYRRLFDPSIQASFNCEIKNMKMHGDASGATMESLNLSYANSEQELTAQARMNNFIIPDENGRDVNIALNLDCKVNDTDFGPIKLDMEVKDLGNMEILAEIKGRAPASSKISRLRAEYKDAGLINLVLENIARQQEISVAQAREQMLGQIKEDLSEQGNPLVADLGVNLEKLVQNPGTINVTIAPENPLSAQQFSMYLLLQPKALNYSFHTTAP